MQPIPPGTEIRQFNQSNSAFSLFHFFIRRKVEIFTISFLMLSDKFLVLEKRQHSGRVFLPAFLFSMVSSATAAVQIKNK